jgi:predicted metalloprotease with PDZ domain
MLDSLVSERKAPDVISAMRTLGLEMVPDKKTKGAWIGLNLANNANCVKVRTHLTGSPCRDTIHTGDEIIAIDGLRVKSASDITAAVYANENVETTFTIAREGVLHDVKITPTANPKHLITVEGKGNKLWNAIKATMR